MNEKNEFVCALAGNPNSGKTTLFNELTGSHYEVGNWAGVTVERKEGICKYAYHNHGTRVDTHEHTSVHKHGEEHKHIRVIDLPGIYSLSPYSQEEVITRDYIMKEKPDLILNIVDATSLERNLYLTTQLAQMGLPMIIALNMMDAVEKSGGVLNADLLEEMLGVTVIPISANKGTGIQDLVTEALEIAKENKPCDLKMPFPDYINDAADSIMKSDGVSRMCALKMLEGENWVEPSESAKKTTDEVLKKCDDIKTLMASARFSFIRNTVGKVLSGMDNHLDEVTEKIDNFTTNKFLAVPLFVLVMFTVFQITFGSFGSMLSDGVDYLVNTLFSGWVSGVLTHFGVSAFIKGLVCNGIIAGVGGVVTFFPQIMLLFLFLSFLEDSGYMARTAFIMDKLFVKIGLSGKSFVPLLMGFGCSVPAIMSARTLENEKDRRLTVLLAPFMSCGAKMPVYAIITAALFPKNAGVVIFGLYALGILLAVISGTIFSKTLLGGEAPPFILEFPQYRMPTFKSIFHHMWDKASDFLTRAGTVLLTASVVIYLLQSLDFTFTPVSADKSMIASIGAVIAPIFKPCGFGTTEISVSLLSGLAAKEAVISSMSILYGAANSSELISVLSGVLTPASALSFLTFVLLYVPCIAAMTAMRTELNSRRLTAFSICWQLIVAWIMSFAVYHAAMLFM